MRWNKWLGAAGALALLGMSGLALAATPPPGSATSGSTTGSTSTSTGAGSTSAGSTGTSNPGGSQAVPATFPNVSYVDPDTSCPLPGAGNGGYMSGPTCQELETGVIKKIPVLVPVSADIQPLSAARLLGLIHRRAWEQNWHWGLPLMSGTHGLQWTAQEQDIYNAAMVAPSPDLLSVLWAEWPQVQGLYGNTTPALNARVGWAQILGTMDPAQQQITYIGWPKSFTEKNVGRQSGMVYNTYIASSRPYVEGKYQGVMVTLYNWRSGYQRRPMMPSQGNPLLYETQLFWVRQNGHWVQMAGATEFLRNAECNAKWVCH